MEAPIGGRLSHALDSYRIVTDDARVLQILKMGYKIPFRSRAPIQKSSQKTPLPATDAARKVLDDEVQGLIAKNAVKVGKPVLGQYVSSYFAVPKSKRSPDKWRPIINLKCFNHSVRNIHFRMEEVAWIRQWLRSGGWFCGIDLKYAFLHVPIHKKFRKFLRFKWGGKAARMASSSIRSKVFSYNLDLNGKASGRFPQRQVWYFAVNIYG